MSYLLRCLVELRSNDFWLHTLNNREFIVHIFSGSSERFPHGQDQKSGENFTLLAHDARVRSRDNDGGRDKRTGSDAANQSSGHEYHDRGQGAGGR